MVMRVVEVEWGGGEGRVVTSIDDKLLPSLHCYTASLLYYTEVGAKQEYIEAVKKYVF